MAELKDPNRQHWNQQFKVLQDTWPKPDNFETCIEICMNVHAMVHAVEMSNCGLWSFEDEMWERMSEAAFRKVHNDDPVNCMEVMAFHPDRRYHNEHFNSGRATNTILRKLA